MMTLNHLLARLSMVAASLTLLAVRSEAQCGVADALEQNDDCANAVLLLTGTHANLTCQGIADPGGEDKDFYRVTVPAGDLLTVDVLHTWSAAEDVDAYLYLASNPNCGDQASYLSSASTLSDNEFLAWVNNTGASTDVIIEVSAFPFSFAAVVCVDYLMVIATGPDPCVAAIDDVFEQNDTCAAAATLTAGFHAGLYVSTSDEDFFKINVPAGDQVFIDQSYNPAAVQLQIDLYDDPNCTNLIDSFGWSGGLNRVAASNTTGVAVDYYARVFVLDQPCGNYNLNVIIQPDPCQIAPDDSLEPNDFCGVFTTLTAGTQSGLFAHVNDEDFYKVFVAAGEQLVIDQTYSPLPSEFVIDLYSDPSCSTLINSIGWGAGLNTAIANNATGIGQDYYFRVFVVDGDCGNYDLNITVHPDPCQVAIDDSFEPNNDCTAAATLAAGFHQGLFVADFNEDFYKVSVAPNDQVIVSQSYIPASTEMVLELYDDVVCSNLLESQGWGAGLNEVSYGNSTPATVDYYVRVRAVDGYCINYDLNVIVQPDPCLAPGLDDTLEQNDSCATAALLAPGTHAGLFLSVNDLDYYQINVPAGDMVTIDQSYGPPVELIMTLFDDPNCTNYITESGWNGGLNTVEWANSSGAPASVYLACTIDNFFTDCSNYDLTVTIAPDPCQNPALDDALEDNDTCATATLISSTLYPSLFVSKADPDVYRFLLNDGGTANITVSHMAANGDLDAFLYDDTPGVCLDGISYLTSAESGDDNEVLSWSNTTGGPVTYYLHVKLWSGSNINCNTYDLDVALVGNILGTATCQGDSTFDAGSGSVGCPCGNNSAVGAGEGCLNSQGHGALIDATGSNVVANDNITFHISQARPNQPSLLLQGNVLIGLPFKDGILCMGNPTERVEVVILDSSGAGSTSSSIVTEGGVPGPGVVRLYQFWYRDPALSLCGSGSNLSAGMRVNWM